MRKLTAIQEGCLIYDRTLSDYTSKVGIWTLLTYCSSLHLLLPTACLGNALFL